MRSVMKLGGLNRHNPCRADVQHGRRSDRGRRLKIFILAMAFSSTLFTGLAHADSSGKEAYKKGQEFQRAQKISEAERQYLLAAEADYSPAMVDLYYIYIFGREEVSKNTYKALSYARKSAELGNSSGQVWLGQFYEDGQGVPKDYDVALSWYRKAADQGEFLAQVQIGDMYLEGRGAPADKVEACGWFMSSYLAYQSSNTEERLKKCRAELSEAELQQAKAKADKHVAEIGSLLRASVADMPRDVAVDVLMNKLTKALYEERYSDAIPILTVLEERGGNLPPEFYFYQADTLARDGRKDEAKKKASAFVARFGRKSPHYARMIEILSQ